jgi:hypothetical protein
MERALNELLDELASRPLRSPSDEDHKQPPPPPPGMILPPALKRRLNHLARSKRPRAYVLVLMKFLEGEGVIVPSGLFVQDPYKPGSGGKVKDSKTKLGRSALTLQLKKILGPGEFTETQFSKALKAPCSLHARAIAKELTPDAFQKNPDAARKHIEEAIRRAKASITDFTEIIPAAKLFFKDLFNRVLTGVFPFD